MWNRRECKPPPLCELETELTDTDMGILMKARSMFQDESTVKFLNDHLSVLTKEHYILSKFKYKIKNQLRREKSLSGFQRVNSCLKRLHDMDIGALMTKIKQCFDISMNDFEGYVCLESRQTLEYCLVRLMGLATLLTQAENYCYFTFKHVMQHLNVGHLIGLNVVLFAAASRVWYVTRSLCIKVCEWYQALFSCHPVLPPTQDKWLTDDTVLPPDLTEWLTVAGFLKRTTETDMEMKEYLSSVDQTDLTSSESVKPRNSPTEDIGEVVTRRICVPEGQTAENKAQVKQPLNSNNAGESLEEANSSCKDSEQNVIDTDTPMKTMKTSDKTKESHTKQRTTDRTEFNLKTNLKSLLTTFEDISIFQQQVKSKVLEVNGNIIKLNKVKKKKILAVIETTLNLIPTHFPKSKKRKSFVKAALPELCKLLKPLMP